MDRTGVVWAAFFSRVLLGLLLLMPAIHKVFVMGADVHAEVLFVQAFATTWIPAPLLLLLGLTIPFLELVAGSLLILGFRTQEALITVGLLLLVVTFGHLLIEPFYDVNTHVLPRAILMLLLFLIPADEDLISLDGQQRKKRLALLSEVQE